MYNKTVGIYHPFPANRSALIEELENDEMNFTCEEIAHISKVKDTKSDVIVIFSPAFLTASMNVSDIQQALMESDKTLIIVAYDLNVWKMDRTRTFYLQQKDNRETIIEVKTVLIMEMMGRSAKQCVGT